MRDDRLRLHALRESATLVALATGAALFFLVVGGAPRLVQGLAWSLFVFDLVAMRLVSIRLRDTVEAVPPSLRSWVREVRPGPIRLER